jgi:hypothetical protein
MLMFLVQKYHFSYLVNPPFCFSPTLIHLHRPSTLFPHPPPPLTEPKLTSPSQTKTTTLHTITTSPTPFYINPKTGQLVNSCPSGKLIGLLFTGGIVLGISACVAMIVGRKRYRKREEKRIMDWVEMSSGHGRYSGASKDGQLKSPTYTQRAVANDKHNSSFPRTWFTFEIWT